jgi:protein-disulfide isomerase
VIREKFLSSDPRRFYSFLAAVVALATVTVALLAWLRGTGGGEALEGEAEVRELLAGIPQSGTSLPSEGAPVTILLYEDFRCSACDRFVREIFPDLAERHVEPDEVTVISEALAPPGTSTGFSIQRVSRS